MNNVAHVLRNIFLISILPVKILFAQTQSDEKPNILPPSPTAMQIERYSMIAASLSSGASNAKIPLSSFTSSNVTIPVSLNYSSTGLKVDQVASRVGLGWTLEAGGIVSRSVFGAPDESRPYSAPPAGFPQVTGQPLRDYIEAAKMEAFDTQPDLYSFNFGSYSGRFIIINGVFQKLQQNALKLEGSPTTGFKITTPAGIKYYFNTVESSSSINSGNLLYRQQIDNAWYLSKIEHPNGDKIFFKYSTATYFYTTSINQKYRYLEGGSGPGCDNSRQYQTNSTTIKNIGVYLTQISCNSRKGGVMQFDYSPRQDVSGDVCLTSIKQFDGVANNSGVVSIFGSEPLRVSVLNYRYSGSQSGGTAASRLFLSSVEQEGKAFSLFYNDLESIPGRLSLSQDHYGYYNGKSNMSLIPKPNEQRYVSEFQGYGFGDRTPDGNFAKKGLLSKICYPTGGSDSIEYEPNLVFTNDTAGCYALNNFSNLTHEGVSTFKRTTTVASQPIKITCPQVVTVNLSCQPRNRSLDGSPSYPPAQYLVTAYLIDADLNPTDTNPGILLEDSYSGNSQVGVDQNLAMAVQLAPGNYKVVLRIQGDAKGIISFGYHKSTQNTDGNSEVAGVRVRRLLSHSPINNSTVIKRYFYTDSLGSRRSSGVLLDRMPQYQRNYNSYSQTIDGTLKTCHYTEFTSSNYFEANATGNHIFYTKVTESQGDSVENGCTEHTYLVGTNEYAGGVIQGNGISSAPLSNLGMYAGLEKSQLVFVKKGASLVPVKKVDYNYTDDARLYDSKVFYVIQTDPGSNVTTSPPNSIADYYYLNLSTYNLYSRWLYPAVITTSQYDENGQNAVITVENTVYNNLVNLLPSTSTVTNSRNGTVTKKFLYPNDTIDNLVAENQNAKDLLISKDIIAPVLEEQTYVNGIRSKTVRSNYAYWPTIGKVLPSSIETQTGSFPLEKRVIFNNYNSNGHLLMMQQNLGPVESYLYGYGDNFVICQVKNAEIRNVAYSSFEAEDLGRWKINGSPVFSGAAKTGATGLTINNNCSLLRDSLNDKETYTVSYWSMDGACDISGSSFKQGNTINNWTYFEHTISGLSAITITGASKRIDELRLHPIAAQMTTYTYSPLVGITSITDARGETAYYEYDSFQRLKNVKDSKGHIISQTDYHYKN